MASLGEAPDLARKYEAMLEMTDINKGSSLHLYIINYSSTLFDDTPPRLNIIKLYLL